MIAQKPVPQLLNLILVFWYLSLSLFEKIIFDKILTPGLEKLFLFRFQQLLKLDSLLRLLSQLVLETYDRLIKARYLLIFDLQPFFQLTNPRFKSTYLLT